MSGAGHTSSEQCMPAAPALGEEEKYTSPANLSYIGRLSQKPKLGQHCWQRPVNLSYSGKVGGSQIKASLSNLAKPCFKKREGKRG